MTLIDIGELISRRPEIRGVTPCIAGTVRRIAQWRKMGFGPEEIARKIPHSITVAEIKLYVDEDAMDSDFVASLRSRQIPVVTVSEAGLVK